jgi:hypothetical protein
VELTSALFCVCFFGIRVELVVVRAHRSALHFGWSSKKVDRIIGGQLEVRRWKCGSQHGGLRKGTGKIEATGKG